MIIRIENYDFTLDQIMHRISKGGSLHLVELVKLEFLALEARVKELESQLLDRGENWKQTANKAEEEIKRLKAQKLKCSTHTSAEPRPAAAVPEWTDEQCLAFLSVAFRHAKISGDIQMEDIRLAVKMINAGAKNHQ